jgi:hypothetical protein
MYRKALLHTAQFLPIPGHGKINTSVYVPIYCTVDECSYWIKYELYSVCISNDKICVERLLYAAHCRIKVVENFKAMSWLCVQQLHIFRFWFTETAPVVHYYCLVDWKILELQEGHFTSHLFQLLVYSWETFCGVWGHLVSFSVAGIQLGDAKCERCEAILFLFQLLAYSWEMLSVRPSCFFFSCWCTVGRCVRSSCFFFSCGCTVGRCVRSSCFFFSCGCTVGRR